MLLTFGPGTASAGQMTDLLRGAGVSVLIDVRTAPGSRRHPHVARAELARWLPEVRHLKHDGRLEEHSLSPGLRLRPDGLLIYDAGQAPLL
jgi:uncharacterized protein (DUF488 family)